MIIELLNATILQLNNSGVAVLDVTDQSISGITSAGPIATGARHLTTNLISVLNGTGQEIHFVPMTEVEYYNYTVDPSITSLIPLANSSEKVLENVHGEITRILCSGVTGHTADVDFVLYKDS